MEPLGIATSVLQVADTGFSLAKNLYQYAQDVKNAKSELHNIAKEIDVTSDVLRNFGNILNDENAKAVCTPQLRFDAQRTLAECKAAFDDLNKTLVPFCKSNGGRTGAGRARLRWPVGKGKTKAHQERLERLKTSLSLMLGIIRYAKDTKSFTSLEQQVPNADRYQIEDLIRSNEALIRSITSSNVSYSDSIASHKDLSPAPYHGLQNLQISVPHEQPNHLVSRDWPVADSADDPISKQLKACIDAAAQVTESLNTALAEWLASRNVPKEHFQGHLQQLCLQAFDLDTILRKSEAHTAPIAKVPMFNPQHQYLPIASLPMAQPHPMSYQRVEPRDLSSPSGTSYEYQATIPPTMVTSPVTPRKNKRQAWYGGPAGEPITPVSNPHAVQGTQRPSPFIKKSDGEIHPKPPAALCSPTSPIPIRSMIAQDAGSMSQAGPNPEPAHATSTNSLPVHSRQRNSMGLNDHTMYTYAATWNQDPNCINSSPPYFAYPSSTNGPAYWSSYQAPLSYNPVPPQWRCTGEVQHSPTKPDSTRESDGCESGSGGLRTKGKRKQSGPVPVAKRQRRRSENQLLHVQEAERGEEESKSTEGLDVAKNFEMLWNRWTNLSPDSVVQTAAVA